MHLKNKFDVGKFTIIAEMQPPKGVDVSAMVNSATRVKKGWMRSSCPKWVTPLCG
jgi:hypothetical protein